MARTKKTEVSEAMETQTTEKVADIVKKQIKAATKAKGSALNREELTKACLTDPDMVDEHGVFMGEDYAKILKKPHAAEELDRIANMYQYDPVKEKMIIRVYFIDCLLAVAPGNPEMKASHITKMSMDAMSRDQEIMLAGAQQVIDKERERFETIDGRLVWSAHRWMAYLRDRANCIASVGDSKTSEASNLKANVLNRISFTRKFYPITLPAGGKLGHCDRSMPGDNYNRATSIKSSEKAPIGTTTYFVVQLENRVVCGKEKDKKVGTREVIREALNNGVSKGTGGWRGSGVSWGTFLWEEIDEKGVVLDGNTYKYLGCTSNEPEFKECFYEFANNHIYTEDNELEFQL